MLWSLKGSAQLQDQSCGEPALFSDQTGFAEAVPRWPSVLSRRGHVMIPLHDAEAELSRLCTAEAAIECVDR